MENMDKGLTVPKWVLINCKKYLKCTEIYLPKLSAQAQKFGILTKKASLGVRSPFAIHKIFHSNQDGLQILTREIVYL
jgi:hypothetical protein